MSTHEPDPRPTTETRTSQPLVRDAPYQLRGAFFEACDCRSVCPCWTGEDPDEGECTGIFAWDIEEGSIEGVDVSGLRAVSVSQHVGFRGDEARQRVVVIIDDTATQRQSDALVAAFTGTLGGPLRELADLLGVLLGVDHGSITLRQEGRLSTLTVDKRLLVEGAATEGNPGSVITLDDGLLSEVLGTPAEVGESWRFRVGLSSYEFAADLRGRSTMRGRFAYDHAPTVD